MRITTATWASDPDTASRPIDPTEDVGVALSGGGTRSASLSLGVLRALVHAGLLSPRRDPQGRVVAQRYLSSVSGGTWCAAPFVFLPVQQNQALFLGKARLAGDLRLAELRAADGSYAQAPAHAPLGTWTLGHLAQGAGDEAWARAVGDAFLRPFGIMTGREKFFCGEQEHLRAILARNANLSSDDFVTVERPDRPVFVMGGAAASGSTWVPFEMSPYAVGRVERDASSSIGSGMVEPVGFDSNVMSRAATTADVELDEYRFSLADAMATSGAAMAAAVNSTVPGLAQAFPRFRYWRPRGDPSLFTTERRFGDGGLFEHNGIIPLVRRGLRRLLVCVHTEEVDPARCVDVARVFGKTLPGHNEAVLGPARGMQVFESQQMASVCAGLARNQGWHQSSLTLVDNPAIGLTGCAGQRCEVLWTYTWKARAFLDALRTEVREQLKPRPTNEFHHFPHIPTFDASLNLSYMPSLPTVKLLAHLAYFQLTQTQAFGHLCALFGADPARTATRLGQWRSSVA